MDEDEELALFQEEQEQRNRLRKLIAMKPVEGDILAWGYVEGRLCLHIGREKNQTRYYICFDEKDKDRLRGLRRKLDEFFQSEEVVAGYV